MKQKLASAVFALGLAFLACSAHAQFDGIYVGAGIGAFKSTLRDETNGGTAGDDRYRSGFNFNTGYGHSLGFLHLAVEGSYTSEIGSIDTSATGTDYKLKNAWALSLLPGIKVNDKTLFFGRIGAARAKPSGTFIAPDTEQNHTGTVWGVGAKGALNNHAALVVEYQSYDFQKKNYASHAADFRPQAAGLMMGLQITF